MTENKQFRQLFVSVTIEKDIVLKMCHQVTSLWGSKVCCANQCAKAVIHLSGTLVRQRGLDVIIGEYILS